jgi:hypothetical protein
MVLTVQAFSVIKMAQNAIFGKKMVYIFDFESKTGKM